MEDGTSDAAVALAALSICENLIAVLMDRNVLSREDIEEMLADAATVDATAAEAEVTAEAGEIIRDLMDGLTMRHH